MMYLVFAGKQKSHIIKPTGFCLKRELLKEHIFYSV